MAAPVTLDFTANSNPLIKEIERIKTEIKGLDSGSKDFNANYKRLMGEASLANRQFNASIKETSQQLKSVADSSGAFGISISGISADLLKFSAGFYAVKSGLGFLKDLSGYIDDINDVSEALGLGAAQMQVWQEQASLSGASSEQFQRGWLR